MDSSFNMSWSTSGSLNDSVVVTSWSDRREKQEDTSTESLREQMVDAVKTQEKFNEDIIIIKEEMNIIRGENAVLVKEVEKLAKALKSLAKDVTKLADKNSVPKKRCNTAVVESRAPKVRRVVDVFPVDTSLGGANFRAGQNGHHSDIGSSIAQNYVAQEPENEIMYLFSKLKSPFK